MLLYVHLSTDVLGISDGVVGNNSLKILNRLVVINYVVKLQRIITMVLLILVTIEFMGKHVLSEPKELRN